MTDAELDSPKTKAALIGSIVEGCVQNPKWGLRELIRDRPAAWLGLDDKDRRRIVAAILDKLDAGKAPKTRAAVRKPVAASRRVRARRA